MNNLLNNEIDKDMNNNDHIDSMWFISLSMSLLYIITIGKKYMYPNEPIYALGLGLL